MTISERIHYDPTTGIFTWAVGDRGIRKGAQAGSVDVYGYRIIRVNRTRYRAHRLAWFLSYGVWPKGEIDHIDGCRDNNRIANLRDVSRAENAQNVVAAQRNNVSCGLLGVTWNKQHRCWQSKLQANKVMHHVGYFDNPEEAHSAYMELKAKLHIGGRSH